MTVKATDADGNADEVSFTVTVRDVVEAATFTITGLSSDEVDENGPWTATPGLTGTPVGAVEWTLAGADAGDFTIVPTTGVVSMVARDYEDPQDTGTNNVYAVTVQARPTPTATTTDASFTVTVRDVVEVVSFTIADLSSDEVDENAAWTATPELTGTPVGAVEWTLVGRVTRGTSRLSPRRVWCRWWRATRRTPSDTCANNVYAVTVKATDADGNAAEVSFTVTVQDAVETATFTITGCRAMRSTRTRRGRPRRG